MRRIGLAFAVLLLVSGAGPAAAVDNRPEIDHARVARLTLDQHILPGYRRLVETFAGLETQAADYCGGPSEAGAARLRERFIEAVRAWGRVAHIGIGPIRTDSRYERIWFWPDRKGIASRQVASALEQQPADYADPAALAQKSIGVQGLTAIEQVLFGRDGEAPPQPQGFACLYLKAVAANLKEIAAALETEWRPDGSFGRLWLAPGLDNASFLKPEETTFTIMRTLLENLERVRDVELARPLGVSESRRVLPGPFDRSRATMIFVAARLDGMRALLEASGIAEELSRLARIKQDDQALGDAKQTLFELDLAAKRAQDLAAQRGILNDPDRRSEAASLGFPLKSGRTALANAIAALTSLPVGYNASDGD
jgi:predicted lipoprotein